MAEIEKTLDITKSDNFFESTVNGVYGGTANGDTLVVYFMETTLKEPQKQIIEIKEVGTTKQATLKMPPSTEITTILKGRVNIPKRDLRTIAEWFTAKADELEKK